MIITLDEVKTFIKHDGAKDDDVLELIMAGVQAKCERYTGRLFDYKAGISEFYSGDGIMSTFVAQRFPVDLETAPRMWDDIKRKFLDDTELEYDEEFAVDPDVGAFIMESGVTAACGIRNVKLSYNGGYADTSGEVTTTASALPSGDTYAIGAETGIRGTETILRTTNDTITTRTFIKFDLSFIPPEATITAATLSLTASVRVVGGGSSTQSIRHVDGADWDEDTLTGANQPSIAGEDATFNAAAIETTYATSILALVKSWADGTVPNYGVAVVGTGGAPGNDIRFYSKESLVIDSKKPTLTVTYKISRPSLIVPDDLRLAVIMQTNHVYQRKDELGLRSVSIGGQTVNNMVEGATMLDGVRVILDRHRRVTI